MTNFKVLLVTGLLSATACTGPQSHIVNQDDNRTGIIGGEIVATDDLIAKSTVAIVASVMFRETEETKNMPNREAQFICTGTLISDNIILTAGHCVPQVGDIYEEAVLYVVFNTDMHKMNPGDVRIVDNYKIHPDYEKVGPMGEDMNDIALIRFNGVKPANYSAAKFLPDDSLLTAGQNVTLAGYGLIETDGVTTKSDEKLRKVDVSIVGDFGKTEVLLDQSQGKGACHGDSGGPAFVTVNSIPYVWGITSRGAGKDGVDDCSLVSVYTKFNAQQDFLIQALIELDY